MRLIYNVDSGRPAALHPPPETKPEILAELPIDVRAIAGVPDLMHHKYVVRDSEAVWTGSANWTIDSWSRQENVLAIVDSSHIAERYRRNFDELWERRNVERSGDIDPEPVDAGGAEARAWFTPGRGEELSQRIATAIGGARERVRIASPVITSGPVLGTLAELAERSRADVAGIVDGPQVRQVFHQWADNGHSAWKIPLLAKTLTGLPFSAKASTPWSPDSKLHDFMHCKMTVADDVVFLGSFNLSRSGERNAENMLELRDADLAERMASYIDEIRALHPAATAPADATTRAQAPPPRATR